MTRFLKKKDRMLFLTGHGTWAPDFRLARSFASSDEASQIRDLLRLKDTEIYFSFAKPFSSPRASARPFAYAGRRAWAGGPRRN